MVLSIGTSLFTYLFLFYMPLNSGGYFNVFLSLGQLENLSHIEPPFTPLGSALPNVSWQPDSSAAHPRWWKCLVVWQSLFMQCHFQSSLLSLKWQSFPLISEHHLKSSSNSTAWCDQTKRGRPGILQASLSCLGTEMRSISTEGTVCTVAVQVVYMCIRVCGVSYFRLPCSPPPFLTKHFKVGGLIENHLSLWSLL